MRAAGEAAQHRGGIVGIARLAEDFVVEHHFGVGAEHDRAGRGHHLQQAGAGLLAGDATHVVVRAFGRAAVFGDVELEGAERVSQAGQQFGASRGTRGEMQHRRESNPRLYADIRAVSG